MDRNWKLFDASGKSTEFLENVCSYLKSKQANTQIDKFADGDTHSIVKESLRGNDVFIFANYEMPLGERLYELDLAINAANSRSPRSINVVLPFHFGSRGERRTTSGEAINLNVIIRKMEKKVNRVITTNAHTPSINALYDYINVSYNDLEVNPIVAQYYIDKFQGIGEITCAALDLGGSKDARKISNLINSRSDIDSALAIIDKDRYAPNQANMGYVIGDVRKKIIIKEDMIDTGGTMLKGCALLKDKGAEYISAYATHGIFSKDAVDKFLIALDNKTIDELVIGDTVPLKKEFRNHPQIKIISYAPFIGESIKIMTREESMSQMYNPDFAIGIYRRLDDMAKMTLPK